MVSVQQWDIVVVGGGAAGLMAAAGAASRGRRVLLLEKNRKLGVKILMSGGTRCNITHHCDAREIVAAFGRQGRFLHSALAALPPADVVKLMESLGVRTKVESTGKVFPVSNKAIDVRDALVRHAQQQGARIETESPVTGIQPTIRADGTNGFEITTPQGSIMTQALIVTTGGLSYPGCGTTGDAFPWATDLGYALVDQVPALVPILSRCQWANELKGITIESTHIAVWPKPESTPDADSPDRRESPRSTKRKPLVERSGSFLFTHWGFSGPAVLDVSREVARSPNKSSLELVCDFLPHRTDEDLRTELTGLKQQSPRQSPIGLLTHYFPRRLVEALLLAAGISPDSRNADLSKSQLNQLIDRVKRCQFGINGTLGFEKAEVTAGGIALNQIDSRTMESKRHPGLYFAGEVLDLDGPIGGFNFQSAFSTGWLAGLSAGDAVG